MRHIIHYRQTVNNILERENYPEPVTGLFKDKIRRRGLVFTSKTLIIRKEGLKKQIDLQDGHSNPQRENESYSTGDTNPKSA